MVITTDNTQYHQNEGEVVSNRFEKLSIKVSNDIEIPVNQHVIPTGVVAKVYGDYRNQLSITADGITVIPTGVVAKVYGNYRNQLSITADGITVIPAKG